MANKSLTVATNATLTAAAESVVITSPPVNINNPGGQGMEVSGVINVSTGTGTTAVVVKCHQGVGTSGTAVGPAGGVSHTIAAATNGQIAYSFLDTTTNATGQQYTVTVTQTGGTANGNAAYATCGVTAVTAAT